jgi:hypothetical protein
MHATSQNPDALSRTETIINIIRADQLRRQESRIWLDPLLEEAADIWDEEMFCIPTDKLRMCWKAARAELGPMERLTARHLLDAWNEQRRKEAARSSRNVTRANPTVEAHPFTPDERAAQLRELRETGCRLGRVPRCHCPESYDAQSACDKREEMVRDEESGEDVPREFWVCAFGRCDFKQEVMPLETPRRATGGAVDGFAPLSGVLDGLAAKRVVPAPQAREDECYAVAVNQ